MGSDVLPSLGDRRIGEPAERDGERVEWGHWLPFFAQGVIDWGLDLPNPFTRQAQHAPNLLQRVLTLATDAEA